MKFLQKTAYLFDINRITKEFNNIFPDKIDWTAHDQIALNSRPDSSDPYYETIGTEIPETGIEFPVVNEIFRETYFEEIFNTLGEIGRVRFMLIRPKKCYSIHRDWETRYHLAIQTNPSCFLMEKLDKTDYKFHHIPADGNVYLANTIYRHTAANFGNDDRIHLVFCLSKTRIAPDWRPDD